MESQNNNGPNQVLPSENLFTSDPNDCVKLKIPKTGLAIETIAPVSVPDLLTRTARKYPEHPALAFKNPQGKWEQITYSDYEHLVRNCAKAFLQLGLEKNHSVCILGYNSPEWFIASLGAIFAGGISAGIYTTNSSLACLHCAKQSRANIIVVQDDKQLQKILEIKDKLPLLKAIIQYEGEPQSPDIISWKRLMEIGGSQNSDKLDVALKQIAINECCLLVFTSGTVGNPKAAMLNHDNITWNALTIAERIGAEKAKEHIISFLPLSHIAAQVVDVFTVMSIAATIHFADKNALKGSLLATLQEVRPTFFLGVPRVWEKIYEKMLQIGSESGYLKSQIASWAKYHGLEQNERRGKGNEVQTWGYTLAHWLVLKRIREALGLDRCRGCFSAAAPMAPDIKKYFLSIDIPLLDAYGMSEASGAHALSADSSFPLNSIGRTLHGMKTKIDEKTGEIYMYGRHVFMGYLDEPEKTRDALNDEGWLLTGDVGHIGEDGFIYVTGRSKELLITAGGENIPPVPIEQIVKAQLSHISNAVLIGDKMKYLTLLLSLKTEVDAEGTPNDKLTSGVKQWLQELECPAETVTEVLQSGPDKRLLEAIQAEINKVNSQATSNAQKIQKFAILPKDFSIATGELGPTMKIKRNVVHSKYADIIENLYI